MEKKFTVILICICMCIILISCKESDSKSDREIVINSRVNCTITVPKSDENREIEVFWQASFYQLYVNKEMYQALDGRLFTYTVGETAELTGENVELLNGSTVYITLYDMSELADEYYYSSLANAYYQGYMGENKLADSDLTEKITDIVGKYVDNARVVAVNFVADGFCFDKNVKVESLYIPELDFNFSMVNLSVDTVEIPDDVEVSDEIIDSSSFGGMFADSHIAKYNFLPINGTATEDIAKIWVESANTCCEVITEENHTKYEATDVIYGSIYTEQKETDYKKGSTVGLEYTYAFEDNLVDNSDTTIASLIVKTELADGRQVWSFVYQPSVILGEYLFLDVVDEEIE